MTGTGQLMRACLFGGVIALSLSIVVTPASATKLACKAGVKEQVFAHASVTIAQSEQESFRHRLEAWGAAQGYHLSGGGMEDPYQHPTLKTWDSILQSENFGVALVIEGTNRNDVVRLSVSNNCWADQEDWRPHWTKLRAQLSAWGYRP